MGHAIQGLLVPPAVAAKAVSVQGALPVALDAGGLAFVPMTDALFEQLATLFAAAAGQAHTEFWKLSPSGALWIAQLSAAGRVAYVETEYFGGDGDQAAAVWENARTILGPRQGDIGPINDALRLLGVSRTHTQDEFAVAGLDRYRATEDWVAG
jgi:hypothetical protein